MGGVSSVLRHDDVVVSYGVCWQDMQNGDVCVGWYSAVSATADDTVDIDHESY